MTAQEQQLIDELVDRIRNTPLQDKDQAAEQHLRQGLAGSPDALYILAQTVIVQKYGLVQAQQRLQALQAELDAARQQAAQTAHPSGGSFLSHIFGSSQQAPPPAPPSQQGWQPVANAGYPQAGAVPPVYPAPGYGYAQPTGYGGSPMGGGGGFLQSALQTAAGVAMGEMAFQSMESLFHGFGGGGGYGGYGGRSFEGDRPSETIINNYNDGDEPHHEHSESSRDRDDSFYNPNDDASRDNDRGSAFADTNSDNSNLGDDSSDNDDNSSLDPGDDNNYDSGSDDNSSSGDDSNY